MNDAVVIAGRAADELGVAWAAVARGIGVIYFVLLAQRRDENTCGRVAAIVEKIMAAIAGFDGHATIPWCPVEWKASLPVWGRARSDFPQMAKLKKLFDPHGILAPGRFVGGL
jgi:glycolate oxidase FAD binding subunit